MFYWLPLIQAENSTDYAVYQNINKESILKNTLTLDDFLVTNKNSIYVFQVSLPVISILMFSIMAYRKLEQNKKEFLFCLICGILSMFIATKYFPWLILPENFYKIQYPWRMLEFSTFFLSIICSANIKILIRRIGIKDFFAMTLLCMIVIATLYSHINYKDEIIPIENYSLPVVTGQNDECLVGMEKMEYLPQKAYENTYYIATRENRVRILEGKCQIENEVKFRDYAKFNVSVENQDTQVEFPYIFYPGYSIKFDGIKLKYFETENGFVGCNLPANEKGTVEIKYTGTAIMKLSKVISIFSLIGFIIYLWKKI